MGQVLHGVDDPFINPGRDQFGESDDIKLPNWGAHHPIAWGAAAIGFLLAGFLVAALVLALAG